MKTKKYNPSKLELDFAKALTSLKSQINDFIEGNEIVKVNTNSDIDNPDLLFKLKDIDGDKHEVVVKIIQRADHIVNK